MAVGRLLVIAPDHDLRRSLAFVLEAEGYEVDAVGALLRPISGYDAVVVDQKAIAGADGRTTNLVTSAPVVLLAARQHPDMAGAVAEVVELPAIGNAVSLAVRRAMQVPA